MKIEQNINKFIVRDRAGGWSAESKHNVRHSHNPFFKNGRAIPDAYIEFVSQYNEFINHQPKPFSAFRDRMMKL